MKTSASLLAIQYWRRPNARPDYRRAGPAARLIMQWLTAPEDVVVHELTFRPMVEADF